MCLRILDPMMSERNQTIVARYAEDGLTLEAIGQEFGITKERVRQIVSGAGVKERHYGSRRREQETRDAYTRISEGETSVTEEAEKLGLKRESLLDRFRKLDLKFATVIKADHGTRHYYQYYGCRCELCREVIRSYQRSLKGKEPPQHGSTSAYVNYGCRCDLCRKAGREMRIRQKGNRNG